MNTWIKNSSIVILLGMLLLFVLSLTPIGGEKIFSNIFVDSYSPRKVLIIERNPIRIIAFGEFGGLDTQDNNTSRWNILIDVIAELRKMEAVPAYPLNQDTNINVNSKLTGDRNRGASKSVVIAAPDGSLQEINTENEVE